MPIEYKKLSAAAMKEEESRLRHVGRGLKQRIELLPRSQYARVLLDSSLLHWLDRQAKQCSVPTVEFIESILRQYRAEQLAKPAKRDAQRYAEAARVLEDLRDTSVPFSIKSQPDAVYRYAPRLERHSFERAWLLVPGPEAVRVLNYIRAGHDVVRRPNWRAPR